MSADDCGRFVRGESNPDIPGSSRTKEDQTKKVCFICGSHTSQIIDIHEPRCGPNMTVVISEKFKMRPLDDDKFLCYSCNNWLVNWYTVQKKNDDSSHEDAQQTTSSTISAAIAANTHGGTATKTIDEEIRFRSNSIWRFGENESDVISFPENNENIDVSNVIQTLRSRLRKYLYYPNRRKFHDLRELPAHPNVTIIESNATPDTHKKCDSCGRSIKRHSTRQKYWLTCRDCRSSMRCERKRSLHRRKTHISSPMLYSPTPNNRTNVFKKLQQLGTSIHYENECSRQNQLKSPQPMTAIQHEPETNEHNKKQPNTWQRITDNESNEILIVFNSVVTEVFPIEKLYKYYDRSEDQISNTQSHDVHSNIDIQEILRNVPKSLTITIA